MPGRRSRPIRRASAGLSAVRAGAALGMLVSAAATYGVGASSAFDYVRLEVDGTRYTDAAAVEATFADVRGRNLFQLATRPLAASLEAMPTVAAARVDVRLPGTLAVTIEERVPVVIWKIGPRRLLTGGDGTLFAELDDAAAADASGLPVIDDRREASSGTSVAEDRGSQGPGLAIGSRLDPADLDAATRLASIVPADVGSAAVSLAVVVTDENGFVVESRPRGWSAIFGFYTASLRPTAMIPGQVRLLRSLLIGREPLVERVVLASETDGTYTPRATPGGGSGRTP